MKQLALHWKILIGMALGVIFGLIMSFIDGGAQLVGDYIKPFGTIFWSSANTFPKVCLNMAPKWVFA